MDSRAEESFKTDGTRSYGVGDAEFMQLEYFTWLIYEAVSYREKNKMQPLTLEINYNGVNFLRDINDGDLGVDTKRYMRLMFGQFEGQITMNIYEEFKLIKTVKNLEDLNFSK